MGIEVTKVHTVKMLLDFGFDFWSEMGLGSLIISRLVCWCGTVLCYMLCVVSRLPASSSCVSQLFAVVPSALYPLPAAVCVLDVLLW